jgi:aminopeptidase N
MKKHQHFIFQLNFMLCSFVLCLQAQDYAPLQKAFTRQDIIENEKDLFINKYYNFNRQLLTNQNQFDITFYNLNLDLDPQNRLLSGKVTIQGRGLRTGLNLLDIDLSADMEIDSIRQDLNALNYSRVQDLIHISLTRSLNAGEMFSITISYHGNPEFSGFGSFGWDYHGTPAAPMIWTLSEPYGAPSWWPCKDLLSDKADSVFISITVPDGLTAVSNGRLVSVIGWETPQTTFTWRTVYPISTYLVSLAISNYQILHDWYVTSDNDSMPVDFYVWPEHLANAEKDLAITTDMISCFAAVFGEYPFLKEKYGLAIFPWGGAMEHQTITSYGAGLITGNHFFDYINAHELAHQWFGDCITMRSWSHIWLNEGFASYAEALWQEHLGGKTAYLNYMKTQERDYFPGSLYVADTTDVGALFSSTVYDKGSWVLHMLRGVLGDSLFLSSLKSYANHPDWKYGNALTEDFQSVCEQESGQDLDWFFTEWVYHDGRPDYSVAWYSYGDNPGTIKIKISQTTAEFYQMPLTLRLSGTGIDTLLNVMNDLNNQEFKFNVSACPDTLIIDPENWVLKHVSVAYLGHFLQELPEKFSVSQNYPNPFNPGTKITIALPQQGRVFIDIYNVLGQRVYTDQINYNAGYQTYFWNGINNQGKLLPSGLYIYRIHNDQAGYTRKMTLIR